MPRLLIVGPWSSGHIQRWIGNIGPEFKIKVITLHGNAPDIDGVEVIRLPAITNTRLDFLLYVNKIKKITKDFSPDIIHAHFLSSYGIVASFLSGYKKILSIWGTDVNGKINTNLILRRLVKYSLGKYDIINVPAVHLADKIQSIRSIDNNRIHVFQYGVETDKLPIKLERNDKTINICSIRNWAPLYHIDDVLLGYKAFREKFKSLDVKLHLYGGGDSFDELRIKKLINELDFSDEEFVFSGRVDREKLMSELSNMDLAVSIPDKDGTPLSLFEVLCIGVYPILSKIDANIEWLDKSHAVFIDSYDKNEIANKFAMACDKLKGDNYPMIVLNNRKNIVLHGDYNRNTQRMYNIYTDILK
ncbi:glycosyltransferase [Serratia sp. L9]|uniref:glycosyltransferase n=1 Tax=Serratia sp. L9 TaxID=3423946 RepID=UPI003D67EDAA